MNDVATEIATYLEDESIGTIGTDLFVGDQPDSSDNVISVFNTGGYQPDKYLPTAKPTVEVLVRNKSYASCASKIQDVVDLLHNQYNVTLVSGGNYYFYIRLVAEPSSLGRDEKGRQEFSANFEIKIRER
jgi:hypothetical protein